MSKWLILLLLSLSSCLTLADAPSILLLKVYDGQQDVRGWVMSEKLDGVRAIWDGKTLKTRKGHLISLPNELKQSLPPFAIDGELWTKRGDFENIVSIVRQSQPDARWQQIHYHIFEVPNQPGDLWMRLGKLQAYLTQNPNPFIKIIPQTILQQTDELQVELKRILSLGGEGLVVRDPHQGYLTGRSGTALKVKEYQDSECIVVKIYPGLGKNSDKMGSLGCEMANGKLVKMGSGFTDAQRVNPPPLGAVITFKYYGLTEYGNPRFPVYLRVREEP